MQASQKTSNSTKSSPAKIALALQKNSPPQQSFEKLAEVSSDSFRFNSYKNKIGGFDINHCSTEEGTILHYISKRIKTPEELSKLFFLIKQGADFTLRDFEGRLFIHCLFLNAPLEVLYAFYRYPDLENLLDEQKICLYTYDNRKQHFLHYLASRPWEECISDLMQRETVDTSIFKTNQVPICSIPTLCSSYIINLL